MTNLSIIVTGVGDLQLCGKRTSWASISGSRLDHKLAIHSIATAALQKEKWTAAASEFSPQGRGTDPRGHHHTSLSGAMCAQLPPSSDMAPAMTTRMISDAVQK